MAENKPNIATTIKEDIAIGLSSVLNLSIGFRVMLRTNLWIAGKLVNGSSGTIVAIVYKKDIRPPDFLLYTERNYDLCEVLISPTRDRSG